MRKKNVIVQVDWREERGKSVLDVAEEHNEVNEAVLTELDDGDIGVVDPETEDVVLFERKSVSDFANSMMDEDDHMRDQVERLEEATGDAARILIEGNMEDFESLRHSRVKVESLRGFVASLEERNWAKIKFCSDLEGLVDYAVRAARKVFEENSASSLRVKSSVGKEAPFEKRVYGLVSGVGAEKAERLYDKYPDLPSALAATQSDLKEIDGVGDSLAREIQTTLQG